MRIGAAVITYQRLARFKRCMRTVLKHAKSLDVLCVVDDHSVTKQREYQRYFKSLEKSGVRVFINDANQGVGHSKNVALNHCFGEGCDYVFTIEDDMLITSANAFSTYIQASQRTKIGYLNYALHGPANACGPRVVLGGIAMYPNCVGSFSMHSKALYERVGLYDEAYINAWEHVDYYYMAAKAGLCTRFWWFADVENSGAMIQEQAGSIEDSSIRIRDDWDANIAKGRAYFQQKHGIDVFAIPQQG